MLHRIRTRRELLFLLLLLLSDQIIFQLLTLTTTTTTTTITTPQPPPPTTTTTTTAAFIATCVDSFTVLPITSRKVLKHLPYWYVPSLFDHSQQQWIYDQRLHGVKSNERESIKYVRFTSRESTQKEHYIISTILYDNLHSSDVCIPATIHDHNQSIIVVSNNRAEKEEHKGNTIASKWLGTITRLMSNNKTTNSFVDAMSVPTYVIKGGGMLSDDDHNTNLPVIQYSYDDIVKISPTFVLDDMLSKDICDDIIDTCEKYNLFQQYNVGKNNHGALQMIVTDEIAQYLSNQLTSFIDISRIERTNQEIFHGLKQLKKMLWSTSSYIPSTSSPYTRVNSTDSTIPKLLEYVGINRRWRIYRYQPGGIETFAPHIDAAFPPSGVNDNRNEFIWDISNGTIMSRLTLLLYLNDNFMGGETNFYQPKYQQQQRNSTNNDDFKLLLSIRPKTGSCLIFPQAVGEDAVDYARLYWPLHEGSPVLYDTKNHNQHSPKYVIRSDILFTSTTNCTTTTHPI